MAFDSGAVDIESQDDREFDSGSLENNVHSNTGVGKKNKKRKRGSAKRRNRRNLRGSGVKGGGAVKAALDYPAVFKHFSVIDAIRALDSDGAPSSEDMPLDVIWDGSKPMIGIDKDGIPVIVHIPNACSSDDVALVNEAMEKYHRNNGTTIQPKPTNDSNARNQASNFKSSPRFPIGVIELGTAIVELGHADRIPRASAINFGSITNTNESAHLNLAFNFCRKANNSILEHVDPEWFHALESIHSSTGETNASSLLIQTVDVSLWTAHTVTWNRHIHDHFDSKDHPRGWSALNVFGTFTQGGDLRVPTLGLRVRFLPGDAVYIRGGLLKHGIDDFHGGNRYAHTSYLPASIVHLYTHCLRQNPYSLPMYDVSQLKLLVEARRSSNDGKHDGKAAGTKMEKYLQMTCQHVACKEVVENVEEPKQPQACISPYQMKLDQLDEALAERSQRKRRKTQK